MPPDDARASAKDRSSAPAETSVDETSRYFTDGEREWYDSERIRACATHLLERCATCGEDQSVSNDYWRRVQRERYVRADDDAGGDESRETAQSGGGGGVSNVRRRPERLFQRERRRASGELVREGARAHSEDARAG